MIYGHDKTIYDTDHLHVETDQFGKIVAVWFRCAALPFEQITADEDRAVEMELMYKNLTVKLHAVDIETK